MQPASPMMLSKRQIDRGLDRALRALIGAVPAIPYVMRPRRRTPVAAWVLGGVGIAIAGGLVAVMLLSPRTRSRTLNAARTAYGRMNERIGRRAQGDAGAANGLVERTESSPPRA
jgi:hypothetical protein